MTTGQQASRVPGSRPSQRVLVIIPTFNAGAGDKTSVADRGRLIGSTLSIN